MPAAENQNFQYIHTINPYKKLKVLIRWSTLMPVLLTGMAQKMYHILFEGGLRDMTNVTLLTVNASDVSPLSQTSLFVICDYYNVACTLVGFTKGSSRED